MRVALAVVWIVAVALATGDAQVAGPQSAGATPASVDASAFLNQYCVTCHNERLKTAGLTLDTMDVEHVGVQAGTWEKVVRKIRTGMMPPAGARRPDRGVLDGFASDLETRLDRAVAPGANLATPALHRLNRNEYANAIRDLLALDIDVAPLLPADGASEGFDNIADALSVSPSLIQGYVSAAMKISRLAVGDRTAAPSQVSYLVPGALAQDRQIEGLPIGTRGGMLIRHTFPLDADYELNVNGGFGPGGAGAAASIDVTLDGAPVTFTNPRKFTVHVNAGPHAIGVALVDRERGTGVDEIYSDFRTNGVFTTPGGIQSVAILGPLSPAGVGDTPSRRKIFVCREQDPSCARRVVTALAHRAYRGPVGGAEIGTLMDFYRQGSADGDFEAGIQQAVARILVAPRFLYRVEREPQGMAAGATYRIDDVELASRLSFFLWSSFPDDELLTLAEAGRLRNAAVLQRQVRRMLADPKSDALVRNFAGQWLYLRELANVQTEAKGFDDNLRQAFRRETELLFAAIVGEDRSLLDLLDADYTFVDERLARHYGIENVRGSYFRRVTLPPGSPRRGLLGHGSMLTVTSVATRTSPVSRGKWVLENLLGTPPPVPPPGVETNLDDPKLAKTATLRQRMEAHRTNPVCASCHRIMDPIGFALENFDLVGAWREYDGSSPIDSSGQLADGTPVKGPGDLRAALLHRSNAFVTTASEKLLTYALGRPMQPVDMPAVRAIVRRMARDRYRFSTLVLGIVESDVFQKRIKTGA